MRITAKITSKGQTTIPLEVRTFLKLDSGDQLEFVKDGDRIYLSPKNRKLVTMAGLLGTPPNGKRASLDDMETAIVEAAVSSSKKVTDDRN